jgi:hypothetical protein
MIKKKKYMQLILIAFILLNLRAFAEDNHHKHEDEQTQKASKNELIKAHQHGVGILNIAQENSKLIFEFELPGFDIVGFEYKAKKKEDIKKVKQAIKVLSDFSNMISLPTNANCEINYSNADLVIAGTHAEFFSKYILNCNNIIEINKIEINYFKSFKNSKKLNVNLVTNNKKETFSNNKLENTLNVKGYFIK